MTPSLAKPKLLFQFEPAANGNKQLLFTKPIDIIKTDDIDAVLPALDQVQEQVDSGYYAAGFVSYEAAPAFDRAMRVCTKGKLPLLWFGIFNEPQSISSDTALSEGSYQIGEWSANITKEDYDCNINEIKNEIYQGNTYQVNYTLRMHTEFGGDDLALFDRLSRNQHGDYAAYLDIGSYSILSASPELFFKRQGNTIIAKPMKGTIKRGLTYYEDEDKKNELFLSTKNRAENVMIVDLLRNDLGKIAVMNSVHVPHLFDIEKYPTLWQMTSTIEADLLPQTSIADIFSALFPCGSVTGAPKVSTMDIIARLESSPRGAYCGAIGYLTPKGDAKFSVPIRTATIDRQAGRAEYGVGGGITWDSTCDDEYDEVLTKAALLGAKVNEFALLETMLLDHGSYAYQERHLRRLADSAAYFAYPLDVDEVKQALADHAAAYPGEQRRVRLLADQAGGINIESAPLTKTADTKPQKVVLAKQPIDKSDPYLYHKTTNRAVYEQQKNTAPSDAFDILLINEEKKITEFTIGNAIISLDGKPVTPPISCGLLPGVMRQELLENGEISEQEISIDDLAHAQKIWLINSVRGWVEVELID